ncbi:MAG: hypothetical protein WAX67_10285 [Rugosibacter sp.]
MKITPWRQFTAVLPSATARIRSGEESVLCSTTLLRSCFISASAMLALHYLRVACGNFSPFPMMRTVIAAQHAAALGLECRLDHRVA